MQHLPVCVAQIQSASVKLGLDSGLGCRAGVAPGPDRGRSPDPGKGLPISGGSPPPDTGPFADGVIAVDHGYVIEAGVITFDGPGAALLNDACVRQTYLG